MSKTDTTNASGNREDLTDITTLLINKDTPILRLAKRGTATAELHEFQADKFSAPTFVPPDQGVDIVPNKDQAENRKRFGGRVQRVVETCSVSREQQKTLTAGVDDEFNAAKVKAVEQNLLNLEALIASDQDSSAPGKKKYTRGLGKWIQNSAQADLPVDPLYRTPTEQVFSDTAANLTEAALKALLQSAWENGGKPTDMVAGPTVANRVDDLLTKAVVSATTTDTRNYNADLASRRIVEGVDFYQGPYGTFSVHRTIYNARTSGSDLSDASRKRAYIFNPDLIELAYFWDMGFEEQVDGGGGPRGFVDTAVAVGCLNPLGCIKITLS